MILEKNLDTGTNIINPITLTLVGINLVAVLCLCLAQLSGLHGKEELKFIFLALIIPAVFVGIFALLVIGYLLIPAYNAKIEYNLNLSIGKTILCLITGAINFFIILFLLKIPVINVIALIFLVIFGVIGFSNLAKLLGDKIYSLSLETSNSFKSLITGIIILELLAVLPIFGQILFIVSFLIGFGAAIIALFVKKSTDLPVEN